MDELPCYVDGQISDGKDGEDEDEEDNDIDNSDGSRKASTDAPEMEMEGHDLSEWIEFDDFDHPTEPSYSLPSSPSPTTESQKINSSDSLEDTAEVFVSMEATTPTTKIMKQFYDLVSPDVTVNRLLVPSNSTIDSCNKRVLEVIDLTDSPIYIPL
ncbi:hypothetical protein QJS10_CPB20g00143 [Acorus calamus]|uniref:ATP-dependent DNA helicase n=1 Tax=Acorus calamus TaxID=4465 RepID=A0AAV9C9G5_ACOCL|nr:hypothetical protein QJS10_CPB20g00143 [Acorus calamus]